MENKLSTVGVSEGDVFKGRGSELIKSQKNNAFTGIIYNRYSVLGIIVMSLLVLISFQNCGTQDYSNTLTQPSGTLVDLSNSDKIPFAYDFMANQISYMSCSRTADSKNGTKASTTHLNNTNTFYTFKVGAYDTAGLTLRSEFISFVKDTYSFKGVLEDQKIKDALVQGGAHKNTSFQLSFRDATPIAAGIFSPSALSGTQNSISKTIDYNLFPYSRFIASTEFQPELVNLFKNPNTRINTLGTGSNPYKLESSLHFEQLNAYLENGAQQIRNFISSSSQTRYLSVTYSEDPNGGGSPGTTTEYIARSANPEISSNLVWGTGYQIKFTTPSQSPFLRPQKNNVLASVQELNLSVLNQPNTPLWSCPASLRFIIVSPKDTGIDGAYPCKETNFANLTSENQKKYAILRRHLPEDQWGIDPGRQCIYPKQSGSDCYGGSNIKKIDYSYNNGAACGQDPNDAYLDTICSEFLSVCVRN